MCTERQDDYVGTLLLALLSVTSTFILESKRASGVNLEIPRAIIFGSHYELIYSVTG